MLEYLMGEHSKSILIENKTQIIPAKEAGNIPIPD
jgi:hypothetical protein